MKQLFLMISLLAIAQMVQATPATDELKQTYMQAGASVFSAERGKALWHKNGLNKQGMQRRCTSCHGGNLKISGKHYRSGKVIQPMAPSVNAKRFIKVKKIKKWLKRNCKWTFGKECSVQEKGDLLTYLSQL